MLAETVVSPSKRFRWMASVVQRLLLPALIVFCASCPFEVWSAPTLVRTENGVNDPPTSDGKLKFDNVGLENSHDTFLYPQNPIITGDNIYAPDLIRFDNAGTPAWQLYYGGWPNPGEVNDRIFYRESNGNDPSGGWSSPQTAVSQGQYIHVNDPSVVVDDLGTYHMVYTTFDAGGDWINYSSSTDGVTWTPSAGSTSTEVGLTDPFGIALGTVDHIARPSLVQTATGWRMWFDALTDVGLVTERRDSYMAETSAAIPTTGFQIKKRYTALAGGAFPGFFEPDVELRDDGTYVAVVQRHFNELWLATSANGINFTFQAKVLDADDPLFGRDKVSNPGLIYDQQADSQHGLAFGMTDSPVLVGHDTGFASSQYTVHVSSPGAAPEDDPVWHSIAVSELLTRQELSTFQFSEFELVRVIDSTTGQVVLEQNFTGAHPGDIWELRSAAELVADFDDDGDVDGKDLLIWQSSAGTSSGATIADGDATGDGAVDGEDLSLWEQHYGFSAGSLAASSSGGSAYAVPEPASCVILLVALVLLSGDRTYGRLSSTTEGR